MRALGVVMIVGVIALFGYASADLPDFGDPNAPATEHLVEPFVEQTHEEIEIPNIVSAILADFRSYDTLGETLVIFTAGLAVLLVLQRGYKRDDGTS